MAWLNFTVPGTTEKEMRVNSDTYAIEVKSGTEWISCYQAGYRVTPGLVASVDEAAGTCQVKEDVASASTVPRFYRLKIPLVGESGLMIDSVFLPSSLFPSDEGGGSGISDEERERLLPEVANNNEIMIWRDSVDRGNNADTRLLLQPATSDNEIIDQGKGNTVPLTLNVGKNVTVNEAGQIVFTSPNSSFQEADVIMIPQSQAAQLITGNNEWCVDLVINVGTYVGQQTVMTLGGGGEYTGNADYACFIMSTERGTFWHWNGTEINMNLLPGNTVLVTVEQWKDDSGLWRLSYYANGSHVFTSSGEHRLSAAVQPLVFGGGYGKSSYFRNTVDAIRFRTAAPYRGKSFTPEARPWLPPAGSWQKANLAELVKTIIDEYPFPDPVTELPVVDATFGRCRYLGIPNAQLTFADPVWQLKSVKMLIRSIADDVTGTIVIVPVVDGVEKPELSVVVPVGATWATVEIPLAIETGELILKRDWTDERDTLKDSEGVAVTAVIRSIREIIGNV